MNGLFTFFISELKVLYSPPNVEIKKPVNILTGFAILLPEAWFVFPTNKRPIPALRSSHS
jgi:hypothetical protein